MTIPDFELDLFVVAEDNEDFGGEVGDSPALVGITVVVGFGNTIVWGRDRKGMSEEDNNGGAGSWDGCRL